MPTKAKKSKAASRLSAFRTRTAIISLLIILMLAVGAVLLYLSPPLKLVSQISDSRQTVLIEGLANHAQLQQTFTAPVDADSLGIYFGNYEVFLESGYLDITISSTSQADFHQVYDMVELKDNQFFYLDYHLQAGDTYNLTINVEGLESIDRVTFMTTQAEGVENLLVINGVAQSCNLVLSYTSSTTDYFAIWYCIFGIILVGVYLVLFIRKEAYGSSKA